MSLQVSPLRQRMIDDMTIRNMSPLTQKSYIRAVKNFSLFFRRSPDKLTFEHVREYQLHRLHNSLVALLSHFPNEAIYQQLRLPRRCRRICWLLR
jgi:hypothetical protein